MLKFLTRNSLYTVSAVAIVVGAYTALNWDSLPVLQRMVGLFFVGIVAHVWEEMRFPGGFVELVASRVNFTRHFSAVGTDAPWHIGSRRAHCDHPTVPPQTALLSRPSDCADGSVAGLGLFHGLRLRPPRDVAAGLGVGISLHGSRPCPRAADRGHRQWNEALRIPKQCTYSIIHKRADRVALVRTRSQPI